jgi:hypothetical protein
MCNNDDDRLAAALQTLRPAGSVLVDASANVAINDLDQRGTLTLS